MKKAIILTDGGICSQIAFCVLGKYLEDKGYEVKYDLSWFKNFGKDVNGVFARDYAMDKAFPNLKFEIADEKDIKNIKHIHIDGYKYLDKLYTKMYISGYPEERLQLIGKYKDYFTDNFNPIDKNEVQNILDEVQNSNSCAIHVRRGDLSQYAVGYGQTPQIDYFLKAMDIIESQNKNTTFYFFSDELDWVQENIIPNIKYNYKLIDKNNSSKGYLDLYIMSRCKNVIATQGSFGNFAKILSPNKNMMLITPYYKDYLFNNFSNITILNCGNKNEDSQNIAIDNLKKKLNKYKKLFKISNLLLIFITLVLFIIIILSFI